MRYVTALQEFVCFYFELPEFGDLVEEAQVCMESNKGSQEADQQRCRGQQRKQI